MNKTDKLSVDFLSTALASIPKMGFAIIHSSGEIVSWSDAATNESGLKAENVVGSNLSAVFGPGDVVTGKPLAALAQAKDGTPFECVVELLLENGETRQVELVLCQLQPTSEGSHLLLSLTDITTQSAERDRLTQSEKRFRTTFDQAAIGMALVTIDGKWLSVNRAMCSIVGYPRIQLLSSHAPILTHPEDRDIEQVEQNRCLVGETNSYQIEKRYLHSDGYVVWVLKTVTLVRSERGEPSYFISQIQDITARKDFVAALRDSEERFRLLSEHATDIVARVSPDGHFEYISPSVKRVLGFKPDQLLGRSAYELVPADDLSSLQVAHKQLIESDQPITVSYRMRTCEGGIVWCEAQAMSVRDPETDKAIHLVVSIRDVSQRKILERRIDEQMMELNEQRALVEAQKYELEGKQMELEAANLELERIARVDALTGVANRRAFQERLEALIANPVRETLFLILLDVDHFKKFNDSFGHQAGDEVLRQVGKILQRCAADGDFVARYGGEEFAILCEGHSRAEALGVAERVRSAIESQSWEHREVTASFGLAEWKEPMSRAQDLIEAADSALYISKENGRNRVSWSGDLQSAA